MLQGAIASHVSSSPPTGVAGPDLRDFFFAKLSLQDPIIILNGGIVFWESPKP